MGTPTKIVKRDGRVVPFDQARIKRAIEKCFRELPNQTKSDPQSLANVVVELLSGELPKVEQVQDIVERVLQESGEFEAAKRYILYRAEHTKDRERRPIPDSVKQAFKESESYFPTPLQQFQFYDKYSRFNYNLGRRETWVETVDRAMTFLIELSGGQLSEKDYSDIRTNVLNMWAMPSMRLIAMSGKAAHRNNICIYNCSYMGVDSIDAFVEALVISMSGCGVGYSVESQYVDKLPQVEPQTGIKHPTFIVPDSSEGWASALRTGFTAWFSGKDVDFDYSLIRKAGVPLKTKGGRASGPDPLKYMLGFARERILSRQGSKLHPLDAHDIMCAIGSASIQGGVRRTALISLFDYDDHEMRNSKTGDFERNNSQRWSANNSAVWPKGITQTELLDQFLTMVKAHNGEPGIFNRDAANAMKPERRKAWNFGTNPLILAA